MNLKMQLKKTKFKSRCDMLKKLFEKINFEIDNTSNFFIYINSVFPFSEWKFKSFSTKLFFFKYLYFLTTIVDVNFVIMEFY